MVSRRKTGGRFDFVSSDKELEPLDKKLGKHAKIGGKIYPKGSQDKYGLWTPDANAEELEKQRVELKAGREKERKEFLNKYGKPSLWQRIKEKLWA